MAYSEGVLIIQFWLPVVSCPLPVAGVSCPLSVVSCPLPVARCQLVDGSDGTTNVEGDNGPMTTDNGLKRNIPVFLRWILVSFGLKHLERVDQFRPREVRLNHFVDKASLGGNVG